jgi:hypothetical protein
MGVEPLNREGLFAELNGHDKSWAPRDAMGHVHLHVAHLPAAEAFDVVPPLTPPGARLPAFPRLPRAATARWI